MRQIRENAFDIKATGRLNRLYVELLKQNPDWDKAEGQEAFNHFMARLIFCFFAEDIYKYCYIWVVSSLSPQHRHLYSHLGYYLG